MGYIHDIVKSTGEDRAEVKKVNESNVNRWGDADESVESTEVTAVIEVLSGQAEEVAEGDFQSGDIRAYVSTDFEDDISEGNIMVYQGKEYRIDEVMKMEIGHEAHIEVRAGKV